MKYLPLKLLPAYISQPWTNVVFQTELPATAYDQNGRVFKVTLPYSDADGTTESGLGTTTTYDGLDRVSTVTSPSSSKLTYTYPNNDVLVVQSPAPVHLLPMRSMARF
jgi:YD repeat-containing protein